MAWQFQCGDSGANFDAQLLAERLFYFTSGYPFLVSKLCKTMAEEIVPARGDNSWTASASKTTPASTN